MEMKRFDIVWVALDPTVGSEVKKSRPAVIVSPDEMNACLNTIIVAPMTSSIKYYPTRETFRFQGADGQVALDQIRTIDKSRVRKKLGHVEGKHAQNILQILQKMFSL